MPLTKTEKMLKFMSSLSVVDPRPEKMKPQYKWNCKTLMRKLNKLALYKA